MPRIDEIKIRRGTASAWTSANPVLSLGEPGFETDTRRTKTGDGVTAWNSLQYNTASVTLEGYTESGTRAGGDLIVKIGDYDFDSEGQYVEIDDANQRIRIFNQGGETIFDSTLKISEGGEIALEKDSFTQTILPASSTLTANRQYRLPENKGGTFAMTDICTYEATNTGTVTLDCDTFDSSYRILTGNTDFQFTNTPSPGESFVKTLEVISTAGETLTFTTADKVIGSFTNDNTTVNLININFANYPTVGLRVTVAITQ